jgi:hypothetical protein
MSTEEGAVVSDRNVFMVFSNPVEGKEPEFNQWYEAVHVPQLLATPGFVSAQRFDVHERAADREAGLPPPAHRYVAIYEIEGDIDATMAAVGEAMLDGRLDMGDSLDRSTAAISFWTPHGPKVESAP